MPPARGARLTPSNWITRFRLKRPFSRKLRIAPSTLVDGGAPPDLARFAADPSLDPLSGAIDFLLATYAGDGARAKQVLARLGESMKAKALSALFAENELRKLTVACFRRASDAGALDGSKAALLLEFAERFDPAFGLLAAGMAEPRPVQRVSFDYVDRVSEKLRVVVLASSATPRPHDLAIRVVSAFAASGVSCTLMPSETDPAEIGPNDLVLIDEDSAFRKDPVKRLAHLDGVRKVAKRLGRILPDPWGWDFNGRVARSADRYDFFWAMAPSLRETAPVRPEKLCLIPFPTGFGREFDEVGRTVKPQAGVGFCGAIEDYNVHRYFWLLAALAGQSGLRVSVTSQQLDGLDLEQSIRRYLGRLLGTEACLSLTMRSTGDRIVVGRTFEVLRGGRLLVQEYTPDARHYLTPGEDFVEIRDAGDLGAVRDRLASGGFAGIRAQGAETFQRAYSDQAIVRHLATWI